ncbi:hypothetical protein SAMN05428962_4422 [Paenibacillus sp. BC26]|nr:hypothetical protein SAMN05428962_4422 [Paenibacillus sp. BC26]
MRMNVSVSYVFLVKVYYFSEDVIRLDQKK